MDFDDFSRSGVEQKLQITGHTASVSQSCFGFEICWLLLGISVGLATNPLFRSVVPGTADTSVTQVGTFPFSAGENPKAKKQSNKILH